MRIDIGSVVTWNSAAGQLLGVVSKIRLDLNAADTIVPWITIERWDTGTKVTLCGTDQYIKMMKLEVVEMEEEYELFSSDGTVIDSYKVAV
jgi:PAS domain-containing protein